MKTPRKPAWWDEFVAFAIKGNAMALAVGTIIGAAFSTITKSITMTSSCPSWPSSWAASTSPS